MPTLTVRIEKEAVEKLKKAADERGVSMEEEHRRILRNNLLSPSTERIPFKDFLRSMPDGVPDEFFQR